MRVPAGVYLVGFAEDLAMVGVARTGPLLEDLIDPVLEQVDRWMLSRGIQLTHQKSEAVILTRRQAYIPPRLLIGGQDISLTMHVRYLGVIMNSRLMFKRHVETVA